MRTIAFKSFIAVLTVMAPLAIVGCGQGSKQAESEEAPVADSLIHLSTAALESGEVVVASVAEVPLADTVVVSGQVQPKPLNLAHVSARVGGTIQSVRAVIGDRVAGGRVLATLYSPEYSAAEGDYLLAHRRAATVAASDRPSFESIARSARQRLELLGAGEADLERLDRTHEASSLLSLRSPMTGVVTEVEAAVGKQVTAGTDLFGIADLRQVWAVVDAYERDLGRLHVGQSATITATAFPGFAFPGRLVSLEGSIKEATRTLDVRLEVGNQALKLKPGMFVTARIATGAVRRVIVLEEGAVQSQGDARVVYVAVTDSTFLERPVEVRPIGGNRAEILHGLQPGERVAVKGSFLVKSQASKGQLGEE
jgi:membrane fusion protein, heavy metal efflux system